MKKGYIISEYHISNTRIPDTLDHKKIVVISDFHNACFGIDNSIIINDIKKINPCMIIISGDLINGDEFREDTLNFLDSLSKICRVYYSEGNHELAYKDKHPDDFYDKIKEKCIYLEDEFIETDNIRIYGLCIGKEYYKRFFRPNMTLNYLSKKLGKVNRECYNILAAHTPAYLKQYSKWGADLVISGHYHGGFIRLPFIGGVISPQVELFPKHCGGHYRYDSTDCVVSKGLGMHTIPLRINNPRELVVVSFETLKET